MKTNKLLFVLIIGLSSAIAVSCSQQTITLAQMRQNIIDDAMKPENYRDLKQDLAFLESQGLLQSDSFYNLLQENVTESDDANFNEVIEKAEDLITKHMRYPFISTLHNAVEENTPLDDYMDIFTNPLFTYVMQHKDSNMTLQNIARGWLLQWGNTKYIGGITALHGTAFQGHIEIARLLIWVGTDLNIQEANHGATPLHTGAMQGHIEIVRLLIQAGGNVNIQKNYNGATPLHIAVLQGHTEIVQFLVEHGADVDIQTNNGLTPLDIAVFQRHTEIVRILRTVRLNHDVQTHAHQIPESVVETEDIQDIMIPSEPSNNQFKAQCCLLS